MTVKELIKELQKYPDDMNCTKVADWDNIDEFDNLETADIEVVDTQYYPDTQFGDNDKEEIIIY